MDTIVLTTANSKTSDPHKYSYKLINAMQLKDNQVCLTNLSMYYTWKNIKALYANNMLRYENAQQQIRDVTLPDGSYSIEDINHFLHMKMKAYGDDDTSITLYPNRVYNRVSIHIDNGFKLTLGKGLAKMLGFSFLIIDRTCHGDLVPSMERVEAVLVHCNLAQNTFTLDSSLIFSFVPDKSYGEQLHQKPNFPLWRPTRKNSEIREINVWFTDQLYRPLEIEDNVLVEINLR